MKTKKQITGIALFVGIVYGFSLGIGAEEKAQPLTRAQYLEQLQIKLDHVARRVNQPTAEGSAVVGIRGSAQETASKQLYWKGRQPKEVVTPDEVKAFRSAVELARAGKIAESSASLKRFQEKYPQSALLTDVQEMQTRLSEPPKP